MTVTTWIIAISIGIVALAFLALVIFLGVTLLSLRQTIADVDEKIHAFDPLFRLLSKTGGALERKAACVRQLANEIEEEQCTREQVRKKEVFNTALEVAEWTLIGVSLWQKIRRRS